MTTFRTFALRNFIAASLMGLSLLAASGQATASTVVGTLGVSAAVTSSCVITGTSAIGLTGQTFSSDGKGQGTVTVTCTNQTPYDIGLDAGGGTGATTAARVLTGSGGATIGYTLSQTGDGQTPWGNTIGTDTKHLIGTGQSVDTPVYMQLDPAGLQAAAAGTYSDTVNVTVTY